MTYKLEFLPSAFKEWHGLDHTIQMQFKKKLVERLEIPEVPAARLTGWPHHYKIKLRTVGYRLVYEVITAKKVLLVIAIGKRDGNKVYGKARERSGLSLEEIRGILPDANIAKTRDRKDRS